MIFYMTKLLFRYLGPCSIYRSTLEYGNVACFLIWRVILHEVTNHCLVCGTILDRIDQGRSLLDCRIDSDRDLFYDNLN